MHAEQLNTCDAALRPPTALCAPPLFLQAFPRMDQPAEEAEAAQAERLGRLETGGTAGAGAGADAAAPPQRLQVVVAGLGAARELVPATGVSLGALQSSGGWMPPRGDYGAGGFCDEAQAANPSAPQPTAEAQAVALALDAALGGATLPASESDTVGYVVVITCPPGVEPSGLEDRVLLSVEACLSAMGVLPAPRGSVTPKQADWSRTSCFCYEDQETCDEYLDEGAGGVSKNDEFRIKNEELCIKNEEFCIKNDEIAGRPKDRGGDQGAVRADGAAL